MDRCLSPPVRHPLALPEHFRSQFFLQARLETETNTG